jgi:hypothetical protein
MSDYTASDFLDPDKFRTGYDTCALRANERYHAACIAFEDYSDVFIGVNDTVSANLKGGNGHMTGYERLGYHAYSCELLRAILDSGCPVTVYRIGSDGSIEKTQICQGV